MQVIPNIDVTAKRPAADAAKATAATPAGKSSSGDAASDKKSGMHLWANGSFSFHDILDAVNPLQHLPIVSTIYREVTGDTIGNAARVAGDAIYGGAIGALFGLANAVSVADTGKDLGQRAVAYLEDDKPASPGNAKVAQTAAPAAASQAHADPGSQTMSAQGQAAGISASSAASAASPPQGGMSMEAALAALPARPPVTLPFFPGAGDPPSGGQDQSSSLQPQASAQGETAKPGRSRSRATFVPLNGLPASPPSSPAAANQLISQNGAAVNTASTGTPLTHGIAIDTSASGILAMQSRGHGPAAIPLHVPPGTFLTQAAPNRTTSPDPGAASDGPVNSGTALPALAASPAPTTAVAAASPNPGAAPTSSGATKTLHDDHDFVMKMREGLAKYTALMARHPHASSSDAAQDAGSGSNEMSQPNDGMPADSTSSTSLPKTLGMTPAIGAASLGGTIGAGVLP